MFSPDPGDVHGGIVSSGHAVSSGGYNHARRSPIENQLMNHQLDRVSRLADGRGRCGRIACPGRVEIAGPFGKRAPPRLRRHRVRFVVRSFLRPDRVAAPRPRQIHGRRTGVRCQFQVYRQYLARLSGRTRPSRSRTAGAGPRTSRSISSASLPRPAGNHPGRPGPRTGPRSRSRWSPTPGSRTASGQSGSPTGIPTSRPRRAGTWTTCPPTTPRNSCPHAAHPADRYRGPGRGRAGLARTLTSTS